MLDKQSTQLRIVIDYYRTTSAAATDRQSTEERVRSIAGLRRRLGPWWNVNKRDVLELGSGTGELCQLAVESGAISVTGVNLSEQENEVAKHWCSADFVCQDVHEYLVAKASSSCDVIFALNFLEHLDKNVLARVLDEAFRVLRPNGVLIAMVPNATSPFGSMTRYWDITHQLAFTPSSVRQLARLAGFLEMEFKECGPVPYGLVSGIRYLLWQGIRGMIWGYLMVELASGKGGIYTADMIFRLRK